MKKVRIVICDCVPESVKLYEDVCRKLGEHCNVMSEIKTYRFADNLLFDLDSQPFRSKLDVVFLTLCDENSVSVVEDIRRIGYAGLIVLTGVNHNSISYEKLFDLSIFDVVNGVKEKRDIERFAGVYRRMVATVEKTREERLALSYGGEVRYIDVSDIMYFEKRERGLVCHYGDNEQFFFLSTIVNLEEQLKGRGFCRASLSHLISLEAVKGIERKNRDYEAVVHNGHRIPVGRQYFVAIKNEMQNELVSL